jgi:hypothetical protein
MTVRWSCVAQSDLFTALRALRHKATWEHRPPQAAPSQRCFLTPSDL